MSLSFFKISISLLLLAAFLCGICGFCNGAFKSFVSDFILSENVEAVKPFGESKTVIIDPGHGGEDPGAVGLGGVLEKELNLEVSLILKELLTLSGCNVVMTRTDDILLYDKNASGTHKGQDLKNRLDYEKKYPGAIFVSIHMNKFSEEYCRGLQVYYSKNNRMSKDLAESVRASVKEYVQPENKREIKAANSSIFILDRITIPAILIECGFLSNTEEAALLSSKDYQSKLAFAIAKALCEGLEIENIEQK